MFTPPPPADLASFGHEVASIRQAKGWTIEDLAERTCVSRQTIINIENAHKGLRLSTAHAVAHAVAHALGVPLAELVAVL